MSILKQWTIKFFIRACLSYLDLGNEPEEKETDKWLAAAWMTPGFRRYIELRDKKIVHELAGGVGMTDRTRDDYIRFIGQRAECLILGVRAKNAYTRDQQQKRKALSTPPQPEATA